MAALRRVADPELGESIVDLGLVASLQIDAQGAQLTLIPTSATCPMLDLLVDDAGQALVDVLPAGAAVEVDVDWDTPWSPERMSPALRTRFGWSGGG
ncbi:MAG: metal-sulfur cluster assembly factor [Burkholderiaceae bacterium]|nr:metal-sulfur cluster assembly factor [Burkholderiaceae bacterium]